VASSMRRRCGPTVWEVVLDAARAVGCNTPRALLGMHHNRWLDTLPLSQAMSDVSYSKTRNRVPLLLARLAAQRAVHGIRLPLQIQTPAQATQEGGVRQSPVASPMLRLMTIAAAPAYGRIKGLERKVRRLPVEMGAPAAKKARR
jgi:hypothetical protein